MKKIVLLLTLCLVMIAATASAEKFRYKDTGFDFKGYKQADLVDIAVQVIDVPDFVADQGSDQKVRLQLLEALGNKKVRLQVEHPDFVTGGPKTTGSVPQITVKIYRLGYQKNYHGPWTETKNYTKSVVVKDYKGKDKTIYFPETTVIDHPEGYDMQAWAELEFNVTDARGGRIIYSVRDSRYRAGEDYDGMLKRICSDFVDDITKN